MGKALLNELIQNGHYLLLIQTGLGVGDGQDADDLIGNDKRNVEKGLHRLIQVFYEDGAREQLFDRFFFELAVQERAE